MSDAQATFDRVNATTRKLDALSAVAYERAKRDLRQWAAADSAAEDWRRDRMRRDAARCDEHQVNYDRALEPFNKAAPPPTGDDHPPSYRRRLFAIGQSMLPSGHELTKFSPDDLDGTLIIPFEEQLFEALAKEGAEPSGSNLPDTVDHPRARRDVFDDSLQRRVVTYKARESFIKSLGRPGRKLAAILHKGEPIWPFISRALVR
jgi:hypothetical protein